MWITAVRDACYTLKNIRDVGTSYLLLRASLRFKDVNLFSNESTSVPVTGGVEERAG